MGFTHRARRTLFCSMGLFIAPALLTAQGLPIERPEVLGFSTVGLQRIGSVVRAHIDSGLIAGNEEPDDGRHS